MWSVLTTNFLITVKVNFSKIEECLIKEITLKLNFQFLRSDCIVENTSLELFYINLSIGIYFVNLEKIIFVIIFHPGKFDFFCC